MARVKRGTINHARHKKVLELTRGYRGRRHRTYKVAHEAMLKALSNAYRDRKQRKGDFRRLWIQRINAAARLNGLSYSQFIAGLTRASIAIDRKMLAELAVNDPASFTRLAEMAKAAPVA